MSTSVKKSSPPAYQPKFKAGAELRERVLNAARKLFAEGGSQNVSMRRIAEDVGCSQMAMYRHFSDKDALMQQLCIDLYESFTLKLHKHYDLIAEPKERLRQAMHNFVTLSAKNPHHYRLVFLESTSDEQKLRTKIADPAIAYFRKQLCLALSPGTPDAVIDERLHQLIACQHGMAVLLITRPHVYRITKDAALRELDYVLDLLLAAR
ncbi:MAG: TetR/AcrR family transcriptional regulator [Terracidiphilus sp.]|nr:TetR/AcrR family transcriptional regulator [Terracidiphilus sp.]